MDSRAGAGRGTSARAVADWRRSPSCGRDAASSYMARSSRRACSPIGTEVADKSTWTRGDRQPRLARTTAPLCCRRCAIEVTRRAVPAGPSSRASWHRVLMRRAAQLLWAAARPRESRGGPRGAGAEAAVEDLHAGWRSLRNQKARAAASPTARRRRPPGGGSTPRRLKAERRAT